MAVPVNTTSAPSIGGRDADLGHFREEVERQPGGHGARRALADELTEERLGTALREQNNMRHP